MKHKARFWFVDIKEIIFEKLQIHKYAPNRIPPTPTYAMIINFRAKLIRAHSSPHPKAIGTRNHSIRFY